jgi:molybdenum cofactor biosynthesis enzyme MoaA
VPDGKRLMKAKSELAATELLQGVKLLQHALVIDKIRITGGEPLVTPQFDDFLPGVMQLPLRDVSMTIHGQLLLKKRDVIVESGIKRLNISLVSNAFQQDFLSMEALLDLISEKYEFARTDAPYDFTADRFEIPGQGIFGIIANESEPFCLSCTRLLLSSEGNLYGCLSS